jgi:Domain of unknown function (DUF4349)
MKRTQQLAVLAALVLAMPLAGCQDRDAADSHAAAPAPSAAPTVSGGELAPTDALEADNSRVQRKLIQTAQLHVEVDNYEKARRQLESELASIGGFVADAEIQHRDGDVSRATLTLRVPSERLHDFLTSAAGSGTVIHESLKTQDVTDGYVDLKARLDNARRLESRLLGLMSERASGMKDLLEVEREIARVRGEIERYQGKLRMWDKQVAMSTVELSIFTRHVYVAAKPPSLSNKLDKALGSSFGALVALGQGLLLLATVLVPWVLPLALVVWGFVRLVRRFRRRAQLAPAAAVPAE